MKIPAGQLKLNLKWIFFFIFLDRNCDQFNNGMSYVLPNNNYCADDRILLNQRLIKKETRVCFRTGFFFNVTKHSTITRGEGARGFSSTRA